jgi:predicted nucleic acid-binding protein
LENMPFSNLDAYRASIAFRAYRQKGGPRTTILPDFLIGAQASVRGWPILTRDPKRFESYFPEVEIVDPLKAQND